MKIRAARLLAVTALAAALAVPASSQSAPDDPDLKAQADQQMRGAMAGANFQPDAAAQTAPLDGPQATLEEPSETDAPPAQTEASQPGVGPVDTQRETEQFQTQQGTGAQGQATGAQGPAKPSEPPTDMANPAPNPLKNPSSGTADYTKKLAEESNLYAPRPDSGGETPPATGLAGRGSGSQSSGPSGAAASGRRPAEAAEAGTGDPSGLTYTRARAIAAENAARFEPALEQPKRFFDRSVPGRDKNPKTLQPRPLVVTAGLPTAN